MRKWIVLAACGIGLALSGCSPRIQGPSQAPQTSTATGLTAGAVAPGPPMTGLLAPSIDGLAMDSTPLGLKQFRGKTVLLNFFTIGCGFCHEEFPHLIELEQKHAGKKFAVVSVALADPSPSDMLEFLGDIHPNFPIVRPTKSPNIAYGLTQVPTNILIAPNGRILDRVEGYDPKVWNKRVADRIARIT